ncbi:rhamnosyltransferase [Pectobacterium aquaticum]|uniref:rhamnosyltransferase n=1 Tax=Pectobacterium aquaticum TaxID=2204145 RepID=UPI000E2279E6|nr:rhamnosyltransferase [Pectobacterium aquaticum]RRN99956.1 rhamnosyltransferase [Pectobacterium aquaticum]
MFSEERTITGVIVTYNPEVDIFSQAIKTISNQLNQLVIMDNNSINILEIEEIVKNVKNVELLKLEKNIGLAAAQNVAIKYNKNNYDNNYVIFFDQDSVISDSFISELIDAENKLTLEGEKVAAVGPSFFDPTNSQFYPATVYSGPFIKRVPLKEKPVEVTFLIASGCMIRKDTLDFIGYMKEELFIDYIDVEWSLRAKYKGYKVFIIPKAKMAHRIGDKRTSFLGRTISIHSPFRRYYLVRNSFFMIRLSYIPLGYKLREITFNIFRVCIGFFLSKQKMKVLKYTLLAIKDGILGNFGICKKIF